MHEGVDTSFTKFGLDPQIDDNPYNKVVPPPNLFYVGWTVPGEWFNMTVDVAATGNYSADLLYTSNRGGAISFDVNGTTRNRAAVHPIHLRHHRPHRVASVASLEHRARHRQDFTCAKAKMSSPFTSSTRAR